MTGGTTRFKVGRYYQHNTGHILHILGWVETYGFGLAMIAERCGTADLIPVGGDESHAVNYHEVTEADWKHQWEHGLPRGQEIDTWTDSNGES
jgi:hypothetical protein